MHRLWHYRLCHRSRAVRLALGEHGVAFELAEEEPWAWRPAFLALNPAGELPVLELRDGPVICGAYAICEFIAEGMRPASGPVRPTQLFPGGPEDRAEVRRLVDWMHGKLDREVLRDIIHEKVYARLADPATAGSPDADILRACRANLRYHLSYLGFLAYQRRWLAGDHISLADHVAAATLSSLDYLGEIAWDDHPVVKEWYSRMKSRPAFRPLLAERVPGCPAPVHYADLDF
jgi:glutathione S-transferase